MSDLSTLHVVLTALGGAGGLAGLGVAADRLIRSLNRWRVYGWSMRPDLTPAEQEYALKLVSLVDGSELAETPVETVKRRLPRPRRSSAKQLPAGPRALPVELNSEAADPETSTAA